MPKKKKMTKINLADFLAKETPQNNPLNLPTGPASKTGVRSKNLPSGPGQGKWSRTTYDERPPRREQEEPSVADKDNNWRSGLKKYPQSEPKQYGYDKTRNSEADTNMNWRKR